jgi:hypothetical protein
LGWGFARKSGISVKKMNFKKSPKNPEKTLQKIGNRKNWIIENGHSLPADKSTEKS